MIWAIGATSSIYLRGWSICRDACCAGPTRRPKSEPLTGVNSLSFLKPGKTVTPDQGALPEVGDCLSPRTPTTMPAAWAELPTTRAGTMEPWTWVDDLAARSPRKLDIDEAVRPPRLFVATSMSVEHRIEPRAGNEKLLLAGSNALFCAAVIWAIGATGSIYLRGWSMRRDACCRDPPGGRRVNP